MVTKVEFVNLKRLADRMERYPVRTVRLIKLGLQNEARGTMMLSRPLVPVDTGNLRGSGRVGPVEVNGHRLSVSMSYGGAAGTGNLGDTNLEDVDYAVIQHENLSYSHTVGQAKYLENPFNQRRSGLSERLATFVRRSAP